MRDDMRLLGRIAAGAARANLIVTVQLSDDDEPQWLVTLATKDIWVDGQRPPGLRNTGWGPRLGDALDDLRSRMGPTITSAVHRGYRLGREDGNASALPEEEER